MRQPTSIKSWLPLLWLCIFFLLTYSLFLGYRPLAVPDEARYSEIPREMLWLHNFVTPYLDFVKYFEKPPLFYWLQTAAIATFGYADWVLRLATMLMSILGIATTYIASRILFNGKVAILAALILGSSLLYFVMGHLATTDMTLSTCLTTSLFAFFISLHTENNTKRRAYVYLAFSTAALAILTKGLVGIIFPCMIFGIWFLINGQWGRLKRSYLFSATLLLLVIALPWHILVQRSNPEFFHYYFITQQFARYATLVAHRYQPIWFFIPIIILGLFPWIVFLPQAVLAACKKGWREQKSVMSFLLIWSISIFIFYSLSDSKLIPYILPIAPPLALLIAHCIATHEKLQRGFRILLWIQILFAIAALIALKQFHTPLSRICLPLFAGLSVIGGIGAFYFYKRSILRAVFWLTLCSLLSFTVMNVEATDIDTRSIKPLALIIRAHIKPGDLVMSYDHYYQDLAFYTQHKVVIVHWKNELAFGLHHQPAARAWMIGYAQWFALWQSHALIFAVMTQGDVTQLQKRYPALIFHVIASTTENALVINQRELP